MSLWPHQERGITEVIASIESGVKGNCLTSPTGGGKTKMMERLILWATDRGMRTVLYTNRRFLLEQTQRTLMQAGISHGVRAAGFNKEDEWPVQISSIQTEGARVYRNKTWKLCEAGLALVDEAHNQANGVAEQVINDHKAAGAAVVGVTATPIDLAHLYDKLIVAGTNSELRKCGALVPVATYAPDEPDARKLKTKTKTGDFTEGEVRKAIMTPTIFARVLEWWKKLNPDGRPTILFAPGVKESMWFAEQFNAAGISAAHIDGEAITFGDVDENGEPVAYASDRQRREDVLGGSKDGTIQVLCNRFVLREGIDAPWLAHGIFATTFGALSSFLQAGGRLPRAYPGLDQVTLQDHGGNFWRHGSLNADRQWDLTWTNHVISSMRERQMREKKMPEPIHCPQCHAIRNTGSSCPKCGHVCSKKSRMVVQVDGILKEMSGDILKPRRVMQRNDTEHKWEQMYHRMKRAGKTFGQAEGLFVHENHYWPPRTIPLMPRDDYDFYHKIGDVPPERLVPKQAGEARFMDGTK